MSTVTARTRTLRRALAISAASAAIVGLAACSSAPADDSGTDTADSGYVTEGVFTVATGEPAYYPWVIDDAPESGEGFEAAVAYAVAEELGFAEDDVVWVRTTFEQAIAPGPKDFDVNLQQFSITEDRKQAVDFSSPYYQTSQVVITTGDSEAADASSIAELQGLIIGAQTGTTSFLAAEAAIAPTGGVQAFNSNDDAKAALEAGQVDAIVVDLPTAFYMTGAELEDGVIVGQLPADESTEGDELAFVLAKDSPLTDEVSAAVDTLREDGTLDELAAEWLGGEENAPVLD